MTCGLKARHARAWLTPTVLPTLSRGLMACGLKARDVTAWGDAHRAEPQAMLQAPASSL
jgi:hypothetical protein